MNTVQEKCLKFRTLISSMDIKFSKVSKFLNQKLALVIQNLLWQFVGYFCFFGAFLDLKETTVLIVIVSLIVVSPASLTNVILFRAWSWNDEETSKTINGLISFLHPSVYSFLISFYEISIMWGISLIKAWISSEKQHWGITFALVALYYVIATTVEIFKINKDRGVLNGFASVFLLIMMKRFGFLAVPITTSVVFGKNLLSSNCCKLCRYQKARNSAKARREDDRKELQLTEIGGEKATQNEPDITETEGDTNVTEDESEIEGATKVEPELTNNFYYLYSWLTTFINFTFGWLFTFLNPLFLAQIVLEITEMGDEKSTKEIGKETTETEGDTKARNEIEIEITEIEDEKATKEIKLEIRDEKSTKEKTEKFPHLYSFLLTFLEVTIVYGLTLAKSWLSAQPNSWYWELIILGAYVIMSGTFEILKIKKDLGVLNGLTSVMVSLLVKRFGYLDGFFSVPLTALVVFFKNLFSEIYRGRQKMTEEEDKEECKAEAEEEEDTEQVLG